MTAVELLIAFQRRGLTVVPGDDGELHYRPRNAISDSERAELARHRDAILALFEAHPVGWRTAAMLAQLPRTGGIPLLLARPVTGPSPGSCCSCGDRLCDDERYRCRSCVQAAVEALAAIR
jgi:hypothetical protein